MSLALLSEHVRSFSMLSKELEGSVCLALEPVSVSEYIGGQGLIYHLHQPFMYPSHGPPKLRKGWAMGRPMEAEGQRVEMIVVA